MRKIFIFSLFLITALPIVWEAGVNRHLFAPGNADSFYNIDSSIETSTAFAIGFDGMSAHRESDLNSAAMARRNLNRRHFAIVCWTTVILFILLGLIWPPAGIVRQRLRKAALAFVVLTLFLSICGLWLHEHFASTSETVTLVLGFSACASLGMPFTATLADKLLAAYKIPGAFAAAIINGIIGAGLGMILFMAGMYLVIFHTNAQYLSILGI